MVGFCAFFKKYRGDPANKNPLLEKFFRDTLSVLGRSLTEEQLCAINMQFGTRGCSVHKVDLPFSISLLHRYVLLLVGWERRSRRRWISNRRRYPSATVGNIAVTALLFALVSILTLTGIFGLSISSGVVLVEKAG